MDNSNKTPCVAGNVESHVASKVVNPVATTVATAAARKTARNNWPTWLRRQRLEMVACCVIALGLFMLLQPFALALYTWSFVVMLAGTVLFMIVSKFPN